MRAKHLPIVFAVVAVLVVARDDVIDLDAGPTGKATGPTAIALRADGFFGLGGEFVALRHVSISVVDVTNIGAARPYVKGFVAFFFAFFVFFSLFLNFIAIENHSQQGGGFHTWHPRAPAGVPH
jgi:hypothetical protein